jgi:hypothetical protein
MFSYQMAKDIKAIQCPKCGSTFKQEIKPEFYRCQNCQTEYYLDSDDTHIYYHHDRGPATQSSAPPVNPKLPIYVLIGVIAFIGITYIATVLLQPKRTTNSTYTTYKPIRSYHGSFVYTNTATGDPIYLRMGVDYIDKGNNKSEQELHAQFNDAMNGKLVADRIIDDEGMRNNRCSLSFKTYSPNLIYAIGCSSILLQLDTKNNRLTNVTQSTFSNFPQLSSGVAKLDFDYSKPIITVMNNEGENFYYLPAVKKLVASEAEADAIWKQTYNAKRYFEFGYMGDYFDDNKVNQLLEVRYLKDADRSVKRDITPERKYFAPSIIYQDENDVIIVVNTTAAPDPPMSIQKIDVETGKVLWALPPDKFYLSGVVKCKQGYAIEYRKDEDADYVHGVMVVSDKGKLIHNYQLSRTE